MTTRDAIKYFESFLESTRKDGIGIPSEEPFRIAIEAMKEKLHNDELRKRLYAICGDEVSIEQIVEGFISHIEEPDKPLENAMILTYEDADQWKKWKQAEKQGRLMELPCAVGDTVYTNFSMQGWYFRKDKKPYSAKVAFIGINGGDGIINVDFGDGRMMQFMISDIGKRVFLTREAAQTVADRKKVD